MLQPLAVSALSIRAFRNLAAIDLAPNARFNVLVGDNGQGKTNLLEAIYVVATSKSFRASKPGDVVQHGAEVAVVRARVVEGEGVREQSVASKPGARLVRLDGKRPARLSSFAVQTPVVVFHPGEVALSMGSGGERRRLLDRLGIYLAPASMEAHAAYVRALRERQRALDVRGPSASDLDAWEALVARHGTAIMTARRDAAERLAPAMTAAFERIAAPGLVATARYVPSAPEDEPAFAALLRRNRAADARRGAANAGPHRDDLALDVGGHPARGIASQGQHRALVLALKSAEIEVVGAARGVQPILLLDDVSSELDRGRTSALFAFLQERHGQVFLTTTRRELIETAGISRQDFAVVSGQITPLG